MIGSWITWYRTKLNYMFHHGVFKKPNSPRQCSYNIIVKHNEHLYYYNVLYDERNSIDTQ